MAYSPGDIVNVNCTSALSKPATRLSWRINDKPVSVRWEGVDKQAAPPKTNKQTDKRNKIKKNSQKKIIAAYKYFFVE